jgi:suppressor of ftsI
VTGWLRKLALSRRQIQVALGVLWLVDGFLKFQPGLWHVGFAQTVITPNAQGQPAPLPWVIRTAAHFVQHGQGLWVTAFGLIEIAIGLGLLFRRTVRPALVVSFAWAAAVWLIGEGLGGVLRGQVSPLMGAPGASYLYAIVGALAWSAAPAEPATMAEPAGTGLRSSAIGSGRFGLAGGLVVWCGLWFLGAVLWLLPHNRAGGSVAGQLTSMAAGEPSWYARFLQALGHDAGTSGLWLAALFAAVSLVIAAGPLLIRRPEMFILAGLAVALLYWVTGEVFGQLLTLAATDPSNGPPLVLLGLGLLPTVPAASPAISPAAQLFRHHRLLTGAGACAALLLPAAVALTPAASPAAAAPAAPSTTGEQEEGMSAGKPLAAPPNLNTATPPVLRLRLVAERTRFDISGKKVWGESYDGDYVGPTLHFVPGEQVYLTLVNHLPTTTNLHFHGLHVSPSGNSDNPYISVPPGRSFTYHLAIPLDQPQGTFWYHDHDMCMGDEGMAMPGMPTPTAPTHCQDIETQIYQRLSGTIIVGDDRTLLPPDLRGITAQTLAFKDMQIRPDGHIVANTGSYAISSDSPTVRLVNGQLRPVLTMRPGQTELWRFVNEGADIFYNLHLPGYRFTFIGPDGYPAAKVTTASTLMLPPAKRWDVLVTASAHPGTAWLSTLPINNGPQGDSYPGVRLMELRVAGRPEQPLPMPAGALPGSLPSLGSTPIARYRTVTLSENAAGTEMYINGQQFNPSKSIFPTPAILGTTEQWTVRNVSGEVHVFHIHTDHFHVMSINGVPQPYIGEQDIVDVPYEKHRVPGVVVIRIHFTDFTGRIMFHCHIASHEDAGMMSFINVVAPPRPSSRR